MGTAKEHIFSLCGKYVGFPDGENPPADMLPVMERAYAEVQEFSRFQYLYSRYTSYHTFLLEEPTYADYLAGSESYLLCATTLGIGIDKQLRRIEVREMSYAVVFNAMAAAYLEEQADAFEAQLGLGERGFRFCPGYGGTSVADNRKIAQLLHAERIGITFLESGLMIPTKSMTGIIKLGSSSRKSCSGCITGGDCAYRKRGTTCYRTVQE